MSTPRTVAFHTLGCKLNYSETSSISKLFRTAGYEEVEFNSHSDIYVINTCTVTEEADRKCRKVVRAAKKHNSTAKIIVIGCYAQLKPNEISEIPGVSLVLGAAQKFNILDYIQDIDPEASHGLAYYSDINELKHFIPSYSIEGRTRSFLKIQDGCNYKCSFCTIPLARGKSRSGSVKSILDSIEQLICKGIKEIVLTGVNIGDFGTASQISNLGTASKESNLLELLKEIDHNFNDCRFRISSIEPNLCNFDIVDFVANSKSFMPHFHIPLQSGDNEILTAMRRRYKRELYKELVIQIKNVMPHACIGADVITGFPGESVRHFQNTYDFISSIDISYLHVFTYSERANTAALNINNSLTPEIRHSQSQTLHHLSDIKKKHFYNQFNETVQRVLIENKKEDQSYSGFSENYLRVHMTSEHQLINQLVDVKLNKLNKDITFQGVVQH
jgi:threonylcarbamoyladenosine tRNA methylthiotransferase MtaB